MGKIHILTKETVDRIAAGEAIERPAAVVKELVENAIDAGARAVTVEIKDGGLSLIRVSDDGCGIGAEDIRTAFMRHATSKIRSADDLMFVSSLGFRGEALSSIASVARVEVITKERDALAAVRYVIEGGEEKAFEETGAPDGTTFFVRDLFYNTPARAKFMKSALSEGAKIAQLMEEMALSRPSTAFRFIVSGQLRLHTRGNGDLKDVILLLYGKDIARELLYVSRADEGIRVSGYIAKPAIYRNNRNFEHYYVNERYVRSSLLARAIEDGYKGKLMQHCFPFTVLHLAIDTDTVDVNVHPAKTEVRILEESAVYEAVRSAVEQTLRTAEMVVSAPIGTKKEERPDAGKRKELRVKTPEPFEKQFGGLYEKTAEKLITEPSAEGGRVPQQSSFIIEKKTPPVIGQVFGTYWMFAEEDSVLVMDQHAAHEKILFERLMRQYEKKEIMTQQLMPAQVAELTANEQAVLSEYAEAFAQLGFEIEQFGDGTYRIGAVPYNLAHTDPKALFIELLSEMETGRSGQDIPSYVRALATEACKAAVKGGTNVTAQQAQELLAELLSCGDPYHCPHGRPTLIRISRYEFEKKFRRIV